MKPFYILVLIIGIAISLFGVISTSGDLINLIMSCRGMGTACWGYISVFEKELIKAPIIHVPILVLGLLILLFAYGKLKTINRTD